MAEKTKDKDRKKIDSAKAWYKIIEGFTKNEKLDKTKLIEILNEEVTRIIQKNIDPEADIYFEVDEENQEIHIFNKNALVVQDEHLKDSRGNVDPSTLIYNIGLSEAQKIDKTKKVGDSVAIEIDLISLKKSKISLVSRTPKVIESSILQAIKTLQKSMIYEKYSKRIGEVVKAVFVSKNSNNSWNVQLVEDQITAFLPANMISSLRKINPGQYQDVTIEDVNKETRLSQVIVSLDSPKIVEAIIKNTIPEVAGGQIEIFDIERQPGERTKVVFKPADGNEGMDIFGPIIGQNSSRISLIINKINEAYEGKNPEKIDIIEYTDDFKEYVIRCFAPAHIVDIVKKPNSENAYYAITVKDAMVQAIGRRGVNTVLAARLTKINLDVISVEEAIKLKLDFDQSRIDEVKEATRSKRRYAHKKPKTQYSRPSQASRNFEKVEVNLDSFDSDVRAFEEQEQDLFDNLELRGDESLDFDELIRRYDSENEEELLFEEPAKEEKIFDKPVTPKEYKKAKDVVDNFEIDEELSNFGLDGDLDLSEFDEDDWK